MTEIEMRLAAVKLAVKLYAGKGDSATVTRAAAVIFEYLKKGT